MHGRATAPKQRPIASRVASLARKHAPATVGSAAIGSAEAGDGVAHAVNAAASAKTALNAAEVKRCLNFASRKFR